MKKGIDKDKFDVLEASGSNVKLFLKKFPHLKTAKTIADIPNFTHQVKFKKVIKQDSKQEELPWLKLAVELQFIAQAGLTYSKDAFDVERFERVRDISAEMMSLGSGYQVDYVKSVFCNETGFQTPKLDTRAAIFENDKILLVEEKNGTWSLPGGWVDVYESIKTNTIKEVKEEAGLDVTPIKLIALQDRKLHNLPVYAYGVTKAFVLCEVAEENLGPT